MNSNPCSKICSNAQHSPNFHEVRFDNPPPHQILSSHTLAGWPCTQLHALSIKRSRQRLQCGQRRCILVHRQAIFIAVTDANLEYGLTTAIGHTHLQLLLQQIELLICGAHQHRFVTDACIIHTAICFHVAVLVRTKVTGLCQMWHNFRRCFQSVNKNTFDFPYISTVCIEQTHLTRGDNDLLLIEIESEFPITIYDAMICNSIRKTPLQLCNSMTQVTNGSFRYRYTNINAFKSKTKNFLIRILHSVILNEYYNWMKIRSSFRRNKKKKKISEMKFVRAVRIQMLDWSHKS